MDKKHEKLIISGVVAGLLILGGVSVYWSYSRPVVEAKKTVVVSENMTNVENNEEDKPLQVVKKEKTDEIEGLNRIIGLTSDSKVIGRIGLNRQEIEEAYKIYNNKDMNDETKFVENCNGQFYQINPSNLEKATFKLENKKFSYDYASVSPDGTKVGNNLIDLTTNHLKDYYIYDIKNNVNKKIFDAGESNFNSWSKNNKYIMGVNREKNCICIYDVEKNIKKNIDLSNKNVNLDFLNNVYSEDGKVIYFKQIGSKSAKKNGGVYKLNVSDEKIEPVMIFSDLISNKNSKNDSNEDFIYNGYLSIINEGKKIVFQGRINGEDGIYIYDVKNKKHNKLVELDTSVRSSFKISPDETKIIYKTFKNKENKKYESIYAAKIKGNELVDKIPLISDEECLSTIKSNLIESNSIFWSSDSRKVILYEPTYFKLEDKIFTGKGVIHTIYFK